MPKSKGDMSWNIPAPQAAAERAPEPDTTVVVGGRYVPPSQRKGSSQSVAKAPVLGELSFPSLADSMSKSYAKDTEGFTEVKSKPSRAVEPVAAPQPGFVCLVSMSAA